MTARWFPHPRQLGIRCVESLLYHAGGKLKLHTDSESIYTIVVMLSEPCAGAFTGGDFVIRESTDRSSDALLRAAPKKGDAIMCVHLLLVAARTFPRCKPSSCRAPAHVWVCSQL